MGIALSTLLSALQSLAHWFHDHLWAEAPRPAHPQPPGTASHPAALPARQRPLRGNWPFTVQPPAPRPAVRKIAHAGTGRIVLSGRMADVCAELDRMAASEALQA
ncbi:MAG: hypothetical protein QM569_04890 [Acidovorax sp.]|uniref:hypothetical protein n=1 Tax=Acidovorax sp. TaxID=1872122 RepID=UPI0039E656C8